MSPGSSDRRKNAALAAGPPGDRNDPTVGSQRRPARLHDRTTERPNDRNDRTTETAETTGRPVRRARSVGRSRAIR
jgi:hypothetical protein